MPGVRRICGRAARCAGAREAARRDGRAARGGRAPARAHPAPARAPSACPDRGRRQGAREDFRRNPRRPDRAARGERDRGPPHPRRRNVRSKQPAQGRQPREGKPRDGRQDGRTRDGVGRLRAALHRRAGRGALDVREDAPGKAEEGAGRLHQRVAESGGAQARAPRASRGEALTPGRAWRDSNLRRGDFEFHYVEWEAAATAVPPPILLLHGLSSNAHYWDRVAGHLTNRRLVALDLTPRDPADAAMPELLADIAVAISDLGLEKPVVVGHSWGAGLALEFVVAHPDVVSGFVFVDGPIHGVARIFTWEEIGRASCREREWSAAVWG